MKLFAVAYISFFDSELTTEIVVAKTIKDAILDHSKIKGDGVISWIKGMPEDIFDIKHEFFNVDSMIDVVEIQIICSESATIELERKDA